ncbi:MAG: acyltransferase [Bacteroidales bacterium]|nr:acyltransferase [Bacteroidales bacterium]
MNIKPHYLLLDGLRGAAALMVLWYHVFEGFAFAGGTAIETFNHGHLGVDFFFMLSGFVISYAYDDRWKKSKDVTPVASNVNSQWSTANGQQSMVNSLSIGSFFKRRLIRLHPMVVMGAVIGLITYLIQGGVQWDGTQVSFHWVMIAFFLGMCLIPIHPGAPYDVRGNGEMFPLNGPSWSLFFEYVGNILYALFIRKLSNKKLAFLCGAIGILWVAFVTFDVSTYDMIGIGWTLDVVNFFGGLLRMLFPFTLGMLMARNFNKTTSRDVTPVASQNVTPVASQNVTPVASQNVTPVASAVNGQWSMVNSQQSTVNSQRSIFWISVVVLFALFSVPYIPKTGNISINGIYELFCIICVFPLIVWFGAKGSTTSAFSTKVCEFLGDISYPLYIVHYPIMYLFYSWLIKNELYTLGETWPVVLLVMATSIVLAYACLKLYDEPIRKRLSSDR